jgi:high-affinity iron transporter
MYAFLLSLALTLSPPDSGNAGGPRGADAARRIVATLQLAAQEYRLAWDGGRLANAAEAEEAALFIAGARAATRELPAPLASQISTRIAHMGALVENQGSADSLARLAADVERRLTVALGVSLDDRPSREPSLASGERIYEQQCAQCHGMRGRGDGPLARGLTPPPANLTDPALLASAVPLDFYRRLTHGVPGTAMPSYEQSLSREERWDVVAHVMALTDTVSARGRSGQLAVVFGTVRGTLGGARELAARGEHGSAALKVLDAYMAYEAIEGALNATDPALVREAEAAFFAMRTAAGGRDVAALASAHRALLATLERSERALVSGRSGAGLFAASLLLVLREGFEAILVIGAIMAVLLKAGAGARRRQVRWGVGLAVVASLATAALLEGVLRVTPAQREALEGGVMLVAAATLFYVSYWLISKVEVAAWTRFVKNSIHKAVVSGSGAALAGAAFLAVYREGFETVLFYKALFIAGGTAGAGAAPVVGGMIVGLALLAVVYVAIEKFGVKIPMRPFFAVTSATLLFMAFTFAGTGMKELQEGGYVSVTPVAGVPRNDLLGLYPTVQTLALQLVMLTAVALALVWTFTIRPARLRAAARREVFEEVGAAVGEREPAEVA